MLNSKLFFILIIVAVVVVNFSLSADNAEQTVLKNQVADNSLAAKELTGGAPAALVVEEKEDSKEAQLQALEKKKNAEKLALLEAQLAQLQEQNKTLAAQINGLDSELAAKKSYISLLQKNNRELKQAQAEQALALVSEADLLKTNIQSQPDLLKTKSSAAEVEQAGEVEEVVLDNELAGDFSGGVEFGFLYAQDNQVTRALNGRLVLDYDIADLFKLNSNLKFELKEEDNAMATEKYRWQLQADYYLDPRNSIFARSDMQRSQFASYDKEDIYTLG
ncbi:MAG TPA: DUF481 domain-containing protein, partial [Psychromonas sp.]